MRGVLRVCGGHDYNSLFLNLFYKILKTPWIDQLIKKLRNLWAGIVFICWTSKETNMEVMKSDTILITMYTPAGWLICFYYQWQIEFYGFLYQCSLWNNEPLFWKLAFLFSNLNIPHTYIQDTMWDTIPLSAWWLCLMTILPVQLLSAIRMS